MNIHILHEKVVDPYFSQIRVLNYAPLKAKFENLVCKISQKVFELKPSYLAY